MKSKTVSIELTLPQLALLKEVFNLCYINNGEQLQKELDPKIWEVFMSEIKAGISDKESLFCKADDIMVAEGLTTSECLKNLGIYIGDDRVIFEDDGNVRVGCTTVSGEVMQKIVDRWLENRG